MKTQKVKIIALMILMGFIMMTHANEVFAQRGRGGERGGFGAHGNVEIHNNIGIVRPHYSYRPYYAFYNYYRPFIGFRINVLPFGYYPFYWNNLPYYFSDGLFYEPYDGGYHVINPPVGAQVPNLPGGSTQVVINGQTYYQFKGVFYTLGVDANGKQVYIVEGKDGVLNTDANPPVVHTGDIIDQLPEGCRQITLKGSTYWVTPDDLYYEPIPNGNSTSYKLIGTMN